MVFPSCSSVDKSTGVGKDCMINIAYNKQLPLCTGTQEKNCRKPDGLCSRDPNFHFDMTESPTNDVCSPVMILLRTHCFLIGLCPYPSHPIFSWFLSSNDGYKS